MKVNIPSAGKVCIPLTVLSFLLILLSPVITRAQGRVLINEYLPWPNNACGVTTEFIELYNFGPGPSNISGYIITDGDYSITIPPNTILLPGKFFVLAGQNIISQNCGNDLRNVPVSLNWNTCGCTSATIPTTGDGLITDGGGSNEQIVLLDSNLKVIDAIARSASVEPSSLITTSTAGGQFTARTFDLDNMNIQYETIGESVGRGNSLARKIDGGCGWIKDTQESAGDINNTTGLTLDWSTNFTITRSSTCSGTGSVEVSVSNTLLFPMRYTLAKDVDANYLYDLNDTYQNGVDSTAPVIQLQGLDAGRYQLIVESSLGCDMTLFDFSILSCLNLVLNQPFPGVRPANENNNTLRIAENPFTSQCTLLMNASNKSEMQVLLYDLQGRQLLAQKITIQKGSNSIRLSTPQINPGMYILQLHDENGHPVQTIKAVKR
jgi:hypothetical protein